MANVTKHNHYDQFQNNKADWAVGYWLRLCPWAHGLGLKATDFESHPQADDVVTLLRIRQSIWHAMTSREQSCWGAYWGIVYRQHYPLNKKFWNKFTSITRQIDNRQHQQKQTQQKIVNLRKQGS